MIQSVLNFADAYPILFWYGIGIITWSLDQVHDYIEWKIRSVLIRLTHTKAETY